jgi:hypothetical protein
VILNIASFHLFFPSGYVLQMLDEDGVAAVLPDTDPEGHGPTEFYVSRLLALTEYSFKIAATNTLPLSTEELQFSNVFTLATIYITLPLVPRRVEAPLANLTGGAVRLFWKAPFDTGMEANCGLAVCVPYVTGAFLLLFSLVPMMEHRWREAELGGL